MGREKPRLLDLFCGAGGAAMGYHRAGFEVVGVDIEPQPNYPFDFYQEDALEYPLVGFDALHASPPCQRYSVLAKAQRNKGKEYPDLLAHVRERLEQTRLPWVIENVPGAPMRADLILCGSMFNMKVRRHRWFELSFPLPTSTPPCDHSTRPVVVSGNNHSGGFTATEIMEAMEMPWAKTRYEVRQAIPLAYTEWIGRRMLEVWNKST
jgi:DNA (cytosine-5)-methyltransferase 1